MESVAEFYCGIGGLHHAYRMAGGKLPVHPFDISLLFAFVKKDRSFVL